MDEVVGLDFSEADTIYSSSNIITGTLIADLSYTSTIYITSPDLLNNSKDAATITASSDVLASINVTVNSLGIIFYEGNARTHLFRKIIDKFTIILKDENNQVLQMNGGWWNITFDLTVLTNSLMKSVMDNIIDLDV